jgi:hypothetical protein
MNRSFFMCGFPRSVLVAALLAGSTTAFAQTIYLPVQYQFGRFGEIYYGGSNGAFTGNPYLFAPEYSRNAQAAAGFGTGDSRGLPSPYTPAIAQLTQTMGWPSADDRPSAYHVPFAITKPLIYSDLEPNVDVGERGFTINDARNEAYLNVPRYLAGPDAGQPAAPEVAESTGPQPAQSPAQAALSNRQKALELITWAKAEQTRAKNPKLVAALLQLAARYDPPAVAKARAEMK